MIVVEVWVEYLKEALYLFVGYPLVERYSKGGQAAMVVMFGSDLRRERGLLYHPRPLEGRGW